APANDGSLYGTTSAELGTSCGTVFKVTPDGALTTLVSYTGGNGCDPWAGLVLARDGSFYGTTREGGDWGYGTVFQMTPGGALTTLVSFHQSNGASPEAPLVQGSDGNLYGTTYFGGDLSLNNGAGAGTLFRIVMPPPPPSLSITQAGHQVVL